MDESGIIEKAVAEALQQQLIPVVGALDESVLKARASQVRLREQIDALVEDLRHAAGLHSVSYQCEAYVGKLRDCKKRLAVVAGILQNCQERLLKLRAGIDKETTRRKALLEQPLPNPP